MTLLPQSTRRPSSLLFTHTSQVMRELRSSFPSVSIAAAYSSSIGVAGMTTRMVISPKCRGASSYIKNQVSS